MEQKIINTEKDLINDLRTVGISISSVWDLVNTKAHYPEAISTLLNHLNLDYNIRIKEGIVRALEVKEAKGIACKELLIEYNNRPVEDSGYRWAIGSTMFVVITINEMDFVIDIVLNKKNGTSRQMFVLALAKIFNPRIEDVLITLLDDEDVVGHAVSVLGKKKSIKAKSKIESLLSSKRSFIRSEAKKALERINREKK